MRSPLLAKSYDRKDFKQGPPDFALLTQHSRDVAAACRALADVIGPAALEAAALDAGELERFAMTLRLCGWMQDVGKANSDFQAMVHDQPQIEQLVRHETVSGFLVWLDPAIRRWLAPMEEVLMVATWGALGHHRKFDEQVGMNQGAALTVHAAHEDFATLLRDMAADLGLPAPPRFERDFTIGRSRRDRADRAAGPMRQQMVDDFRDAEADFKDDRQRRFVALVKGLGIAADVAASAVARRHVMAARYSLPEFIARSLSTRLTRSELTGLIHRWAWQTYDGRAPVDLSQLPPGFGYRPFQEDVAASPSRLTLAEAGCGSGKSVAAYLWAREWCARREIAGAPGFRLFFCLPTTGTTTEHFRDYALEADVPAELVHSRASVDLHTLATTADQEEDDDGEDGDNRSKRAESAKNALRAERDKIEALALWDARVAVTTADTVLGLMANARRALCALPAIVQSAIVFDEIHAFDDHLFGHLLVFLRNFPGIPVLLMTASLPEARRRALAEVRTDLHVVPGPTDLETLPRYRLAEIESPEACWPEIDDCLRGGGKVLWVRNQVEWANAVYRRAIERFPEMSVDVYHSRLRYRDRSRRHRRVIDRFKRAGTPALLVATQVAEMSLDLSADLLVTDEASVPALIQRLGRLNRHATPKSPGSPKRALIVPVARKEALPYSPEEIEASRSWRSALVKLGRALHQRDLSEQFSAGASAHSLDYSAAEEAAVFLGVPERSGLWRTRPGSTRGAGYTVAVLLERDVAAHRRARGDDVPAAEWLREHEVSIPIKQAVLGWPRVAGLPVAPDDVVVYDYDEATGEGTGARWRES
ncbi:MULTISPECIES: CRISPR-associated helicase Cas3' [Sorangium]|uniref:ATP-dependent RNA helicase n=1 Tax=Sorangium cellulosum TaxID=56 RepID=A0A4P2R5M9_SORCE|nr:MULTISPECIES: CRISPR-associated helicase Cas3' [Sorangium]AUX38430.1 ATP-dependent RNA helicase [Sorangium cellulosum]WCQ97718.1 Putative CRISPR-associated nuclease/helicase Cas3 [Sorangium sp. Soce836]